MRIFTWLIISNKILEMWKVWKMRDLLYYFLVWAMVIFSNSFPFLSAKNRLNESTEIFCFWAIAMPSLVVNSAGKALYSKNISLGNCSKEVEEFVISCTLWAVVRKYSAINIAPSTLVLSISSLPDSPQAYRESCSIRLKRIMYISNLLYTPTDTSSISLLHKSVLLCCQQ